MQVEIGALDGQPRHAADDGKLFVEALRRNRGAGHGDRAEPLFAVRIGGDTGAAFAACDLALQLRRRRAFKKDRIRVRNRVVVADRRSEGTGAQAHPVEAVVLQVEVLNTAAVFLARAAEFVDQAVLPIVLDLAFDAELGAAKVGAVVQVAGAE